MLTKPTNEKLLPGKTYHIFNRAVGADLLFRCEDDYRLFLQNLARFILPFSRIFAYCLMPNHFHLLLEVFSEAELDLNKTNSKNQLIKSVNQPFSNFFNSYAVIYNQKYSRKGKLFMLPYKRIPVHDQTYFIVATNYIHRNPVHHGLVDTCDKWVYSSFNDYCDQRESFLEKELVLEIFGGLEKMMFFHGTDLTGR